MLSLNHGLTNHFSFIHFHFFSQVKLNNGQKNNKGKCTPKRVNLQCLDIQYILGLVNMAKNDIMIYIFNYLYKYQIIIYLNFKVRFLFLSSWINQELGDVGEIDITMAIGTFAQ